MGANKDGGGKSEAIAQYKSICEMVKALADAEDAGGAGEARDEAERCIHEDALSVEVRSDWVSYGAQEGMTPHEFNILLCTGGPRLSHPRHARQLRRAGNRPT